MNIRIGQHDVVFLTPPPLVALAATYGAKQVTKLFIQNGGVLSGIMPISRTNVEEAQARLDMGVDPP